MPDNNLNIEKSTSPLVSVIIPLYNHELYISETVDSVLQQTYRDFEILIVDDGSTDGSADIVKEIKDIRVKYIHQDNKGAHEAINKGIALARGSYIGILNSDDVYHEERLEQALKEFHNDRDIAAVFSYVELVDQQGRHVRIKDGARDNWLVHDADSSFKEEDQSVLSLLAGNFLHSTSNLICKREIFDEIGLFAPLRYVHDYDFFLRLCYRYKVVLIEKPLLKYRLHDKNTLTENFAASNFETALVLAHFLVNYNLEDFFPSSDPGVYLMMKLFNSLNTYNTDRVVLVLLLFWLKYADRAAPFSELSENSDNPFRKACLAHIEETRDSALLNESIQWQKGQTTLWWEKAKELKEETGLWRDKAEELTKTADWQKEQTDFWWSRCQTTKEALSWQKEQTDVWWGKATAMEARVDRLERDLAWQKGQTDMWWQHAQKAEQLLASREEIIRHLNARLDIYAKLTRPVQALFPAGTRRRMWLKRLIRKCLTLF